MRGSIATEPPYHSSTAPAVVEALHEVSRVIQIGGRIAMLSVSDQAPLLRIAADSLALVCLLDFPIDRKGTACSLLAWQGC